MKLRLGGTCALALAAGLSVGASNRAGHVPDPIGHRTVVLGRSVDGRAITAVETGDFEMLGRSREIRR
jgi:hypothetical protein